MLGGGSPCKRTETDRSTCPTIRGSPSAEGSSLEVSVRGSHLSDSCHPNTSDQQLNHHQRSAIQQVIVSHAQKCTRTDPASTHEEGDLRQGDNNRQGAKMWPCNISATGTPGTGTPHDCNGTSKVPARGDEAPPGKPPNPHADNARRGAPRCRARERSPKPTRTEPARTHGKGGLRRGDSNRQGQHISYGGTRTPGHSTENSRQATPPTRRQATLAGTHRDAMRENNLGPAQHACHAHHLRALQINLSV